VDHVVGLNDTIRMGSADVVTAAGACQRICELLHGALQSAHGPDTALVRLYQSVRAGQLPAETRVFAERLADHPIEDETPCLTLLGTDGIEPAWRSRRTSRSHQAIALSDAEEVNARTPMVGGLFAQLGIDVDAIVRQRPDEKLLLHHRDYGVFHVPDPSVSPFIPDQTFVRAYAIRSVVGCGGVLPSGEVFALILFATVDIPEKVVPLFRTLAYGIKAALVPYTFKTFDSV
jgi:hypothetical protein